jgi:hypothetical protein
VQAKEKEKEDLLLMLEYTPKQMLVYVVSLTSSCHGINGYSRSLLENIRQFGNKSVIVPTFVFTNFATLKDRWTSKDLLWEKYRKTRRREDHVKSLDDDDLQDSFRRFLLALTFAGWDKKPFQVVCLDAHYALMPERASDTDSDSEDDELQRQKEEVRRLDARQKSRGAVGVFWHELLGSGENVELQQAQTTLSRTLEALIWDAIVPGEKIIRKSLLLPVVPPELHDRVRAAQASQMKKFESHVRSLFPHTSLDKGDKYSEQQLQDGDGLKKGLRAIIWDCILRQNKLHNPKWDEYIETCVQRSLNEFEEQVLRALTNARHDVSNKLLDDIVAIALGAVDLAEQHARSKHEMINMHWKRGWASASARVGTLSRGCGVLEDTLRPPLTSPQSWGIWTYPQARPEVYHICISNIMKRKKGLISSIFIKSRSNCLTLTLQIFCKPSFLSMM